MGRGGGRGGGPKKGEVQANPAEANAVDPKVISEILERLAKLEKWKAKWKERKERKRQKKDKADKKKQKRSLRKNEEEERTKKRAKKDVSSSPAPVSNAPPPEVDAAVKKPTAAKSKPKAKAKNLAALPAPVKGEPSQGSHEQLARNAPKEAAKPVEAAKGEQAKTEAEDAANKVVPSDPRAAHCCYDMLQIDRTATVEQVKRAYRSLAIKMHPDKGGSHKAFCALQLAFDVLQDEVERQAYDRELRESRSRDGQVGQAVDSAPVVQPAAVSPVMLRDALMGTPPRHWPEMLKELLTVNLKLLQEFLNMSQQQQNEVAKEHQESHPQHSKAGVPGICRSGNFYYAKASRAHISINSKPATLVEAIDANIALKQIWNIVKKYPDDLEGGLRRAVKERREIDQDTIFFMRFRLDFRWESIRITTPQSSDVESMLRDRRTLLKLAERRASKDEFQKAQQAMKENAQEELVAQRNYASVRQQLVAEVAREVLWRHAADSRSLLSLKNRADEAASDPESSDSDTSSSSSSS